ncbi:MAG TPA: hypothetical protein VMS82_05255, partial [Pseudolabrys sp.]|nr:hypothetical protein [Pseudolabrys sp.]
MLTILPVPASITESGSEPHQGADMPHKKTLEELKRETIDELERRGYDVRGKAPAQIRQMLRARHKKPKSNATS